MAGRGASVPVNFSTRAICIRNRCISLTSPRPTAADPVCAGLFQLPGFAYSKPDSVQHRLRGFRLLNQLNASNKWDEIGSFLGASYFRRLGKNQRYGESARGLALNCGGDGPKEFPIFTDWWLGKPQPDDSDLTLYAILDSVSCTGAYEFHIYPGESTMVDVTAELFFREPAQIHAADTNARPIQTIGLVPLTSMFWFGKNTERKFDDYRPEVHDSDGLLAHMDSGEILWRPLDNPSSLRHQVFHAPNIRGFGLLQRERSFLGYEDTFNFYWEALERLERAARRLARRRFAPGGIEHHLRGILYNIVAFWYPKDKPAPLQALPLRLPALLAERRGGPEAFRKPRRLHARRRWTRISRTRGSSSLILSGRNWAPFPKTIRRRPSPIAAPTPPSWTISSCATRSSTAGAWF